MKKLLCLAIAIVLSASLCACSKDDDSASVKIPDAASNETSMTYEEAIEPLKSDETLVKIYERAEMILRHIDCVNSYYNDRAYNGHFGPGNEISNENGITDSMNALKEYFESEAQYTNYIKTISNPVIKDSYLKFIDLAREIYQKFADNPTKSAAEEVSTSITTLELYIFNIDFYPSVNRADYYLNAYTIKVYDNLAFIEAYCMLTPKEIKRLTSAELPEEYKQRMTNATVQCNNIDWTYSAEGLDLDYLISTLDSLMMLKDNAYAIAVEAYGSDSQKLAAYDDFIKKATKLYNIVRVNRPEFNDTEYIEKQGFDLDTISEYR